MRKTWILPRDGKFCTSRPSLHPYRPQAMFLAAILLLSIKITSSMGLLYVNSSSKHSVNEMMKNEDDWGLVEKKGTHFVIKDQPFLVNGFNTYWLMVFASDPTTRHKVSEVLGEAAAAGLNVCRTWAFNDGGWRALQVSPYVYDEAVFQGLDFVVSEARRHNVRLILSLCNNWEDYGGKAQYVKWGMDAGLNLTSDEDFFSDLTIKTYYKAFAKAVITRVNSFTNMAYKDDPTILAWELINEPRCTSDPSGDTLQAWIEEMASYVKSIDSKHLLEVGVEGFYGPSTPEKLQLNPNDFAGQTGTDFIRNHQVPGIDFASAHIYSDIWLSETISEEHLRFATSWMNHHMDDAEKLLGMPVVFGEFGVSVKDGRFTFEFRGEFIETVYGTLLSSRKIGAVGGGCLLWQLFPEGTDHMDDGYAIILAQSPSMLQMLSHHSKKLHAEHAEGFWKALQSWEEATHEHEEL